MVRTLFLLLAACALSSAWMINSRVNFTDLDEVWAENIANAAENLVKTPSSCIPANTTILTMSNGYHWNLLDLKVSKILDQKCFFDRYMVITIDTDAHAKCEAHPSVQHCFHYHTALQPSDWKKADYYSIVYIKIKAMRAIVQRGLPVFFFDTDIVLFKVPPFPPPDTYDIAYQMEKFDIGCEMKLGLQGGLAANRNDSCRGSGINTGQFGLWPSNITVKLMNDTFNCGERSTRPKARGPPIGTQDCMNMEVKRESFKNLRVLKLPSHFGGHCWTRYVPLSKLKLTSYHANCITSSHGKKMLLLDIARRGQARPIDEW